jgi:hypothetical protein
MDASVDVEGLHNYFRAVGGRHVQRVQLVGVQRINDVLEMFGTYFNRISQLIVQDVSGYVIVTSALTSTLLLTIVFDNFTLDTSYNLAGLHLPHLRKMFLNCTADMGVLYAFLSASTRLEKVRVMRVPVDDVAVGFLCISAASLQILVSEDCGGVTNQAWQKLAGCCKSLRVIQSQQCGPNNEHGVAALIKCSVHLESVRLKGG